MSNDQIEITNVKLQIHNSITNYQSQDYFYIEHRSTSIEIWNLIGYWLFDSGNLLSNLSFVICSYC